MKKKIALFGILLTVLSIIGTCFLVYAQESTVYISSSGSNANNGKTEATAVADFERAFALLPKGGRIVLLRLPSSVLCLSFSKRKSNNRTKRRVEKSTILCPLFSLDRVCCIW